SHVEAAALAPLDDAVAGGIDVMADVCPYVIDMPAGDGEAQMAMFVVDERDPGRTLVHPRVMIGSDGEAVAPSRDLSADRRHPRSYGTFPRVLGRYAGAQRVLTLPQAVFKMTGLPARRLGLRDRGVICEGAKADLVVFDPRTVADRATEEDPHRYPLGI